MFAETLSTNFEHQTSDTTENEAGMLDDEKKTPSEDNDHGFLRESTPEDQVMQETELKQPSTSGISNNLISPVVIAPYPKATEVAAPKKKARPQYLQKNRKIRADQIKPNRTKKSKNKAITNKSSSKSKNIFKSKNSIKTKFESDDSSESDVDVECLFCGNNYGNDHHGEGWIMCGKCGKWAYDACARVESDDDVVFLCEICLESFYGHFFHLLNVFCVLCSYPILPT
ncbi:hypothetical protein FQA39_LY14206 [Lamprigera yunnana]|nr:hypothetical protein FQA39_LY14206 [Lamprigera yunnana]